MLEKQAKEVAARSHPCTLEFWSSGAVLLTNHAEGDGNVMIFKESYRTWVYSPPHPSVGMRTAAESFGEEGRRHEKYKFFATSSSEYN